jgi:ABC-type Fe3+-hydroxamate transport system substrate-binding protein
VSLVPSLTESVAATAPELIVGATDWCTHPPGLDVPRVGGTKNPRLDDVVALRPDLVLVNDEENRPDDIDELRRRGVRVWLTDYKTVPDAITGLTDILDGLGVEPPPWIQKADQEWSEPWDGQRTTAVVPIWRRPWMALGRDTFAGDVLRRLGVDNALGEHPARYPRIDLETLPPHDLVVLPDEPYEFSADDGPEAFAAPSRLVSGRHLTWYGPSLAEARGVLATQIWGAAAP